MFKQFLDHGKGYFGSKPNVPLAPTSNQILSDTIAANTANMPFAEALSGGVNQFNQEQMISMLKKVVPNYDSIMTKGGNVVSDMLSGKIPADVAAQIGRSSAERSLAGGFSGSGMARNLEARDLGLTSLSLTTQGLGAAERWISFARDTATPRSFGVENMFISPAQQAGISEEKFQRDWLEQKIIAAPDPVRRGRADQEMALFSTIMSAVGGMAGGGGGGGGNTQFRTADYGGGEDLSSMRARDRSEGRSSDTGE